MTNDPPPHDTVDTVDPAGSARGAAPGTAASAPGTASGDSAGADTSRTVSTTSARPRLTRSPFDSETFTAATFVTVGRGPLLALAATWAVTRAGMLFLLWRDRLGIGGVASEVYALYHYWYGLFAHGTFPPGDVTWQYPPGAALAVISPALLPWFTYFQAFVLLVLLADAVVVLALAVADRDRLTHGAWYWVLGLPLLLHLPFARYDLMPTALAVLALLALRSRRALAHRAGGVLAGLGAMIKVWPALALIGTPRGRTTRDTWMAAAITAATLLATLALMFTGSLDFLRQQSGRGIQIESVTGTVLALARAAGVWQGFVELRYGAFEYVGPYVSTLAHLALLLTALAFIWLLLWRLRARTWTAATPADAALAAVLMFTVTSRVISPQYLIWLLGLGAVCLTFRATVMRPVAMLLLPAAALSSLAYPVLYMDVVTGTWQGVTVMALRNGVLLAAAALAARRLWTATVPPNA
ncbi:glycosyltransferase 87 family protein [Streptomyces sp. NPDC048717]|uniref:glycosyltransferase 87 family protein n=1 Tax=Streptomyces sp. NPDC048717 TaxID=3154928 RepID=UPI00344A2E3F